jgi:hypothetical protein
MQSAVANVPVVSTATGSGYTLQPVGHTPPLPVWLYLLLAATMGTPVHVRLLFRNVYSRAKFTSDRDFSVDLFGRMSTSLKSRRISVSMRGMVAEMQCTVSSSVSRQSIEV